MLAAVPDPPEDTERAERDPRLMPVRFSNLKRMGESPAHYLAGLREPHRSSDAQRFGSLVHAVLLGGDVLVWEADRRGKAWTAFRDAHPDELIVTASERDRAHRCADAVHARPDADELMVGNHELPVDWRIGDRACSSRIDVLGWTHVAELKTAHTTRPEKFKRDCLGYAYHAQLAWYRMAAAHRGRKVERAGIVGVETKPPYAVTVLHLTARALDAGERMVRLWYEQLLQCEASGQWPGYCQSPLDLDVDGDSEITIDGEALSF